MRLSLEEKLKIVKLHLDEGIPIFEIECSYGLNHSTVKYCCALYQKWGEKAFRVNAKLTRKVSKCQKAAKAPLNPGKKSGNFNSIFLIQEKIFCIKNLEKLQTNTIMFLLKI